MARLARGHREHAYLLAELGRCLAGRRPGIAPTSVQAEWGMLSRATQRPTSSRLWDQKHPRSPFGGGHPLRGLDSTGLNQERDTRTPQKRHHRIIESSRLDWFRLGIQNTYRQTAVACPRTEHFEHFVSVLGTEVASVSSPPCGSEGVREKKIIKKWHVSVVRWCGEADQGCLISRQICRVCREAFSATQQSDSQRGDSTSRLLGSVLHLISCTRAVPA